MKILHIDSSIMQHDSITRELSAELIQQLLDTQDDATVIYRDPML
ncbi:NAD(P)H-dependent oxidoreductase [Candidatus Symbiopectobacterium sp. NZEC135]|nr:NAD(P)H-dependent oxidoreductase [Candidatus Symbiopectobacterium sp. NZEC135]MCW2480324.1 NAD(P)H-dependent oxidoreductase [Candidatus Symbiopectobacterium sp. NZEC135]